MTEPYQAGDLNEPDVPGDVAQPPGMPQWVKITGVVIGLLVVILVAVAVLGGGGGGHGPGMHGGLSDLKAQSDAAVPRALR
jgi:dihydroxyacetone kinase